jgi:hypothetical protein
MTKFPSSLRDHVCFDLLTPGTLSLATFHGSLRDKSAQLSQRNLTPKSAIFFNALGIKWIAATCGRQKKFHLDSLCPSGVAIIGA